MKRFQALFGDDARDVAALLVGLLDSAMDAIITVDAQQHVVLYNRAAEKIFGWPRDEVLGEPLEKLIPGRFRGDHAAHVERFGATGVTSRRMGVLNVIKGLRASGEEFPMDASISQLDTHHGKFYTVILRDVTDRVRTQEELREFAAAAHAIRENEKTRVARELHDELAQSLTALKMDTIWVKDNCDAVAVAGPSPVGDKLDGMLAMLDRAVGSTRRIAADLRPLLLDDLGLVPAIEWLAATFTQRHGLQVDVSVDEDLDLGEPYATAVFRIVQESLQNVAKHAHASEATVSIEVADGTITLEVDDDGRGFDPKAPRKRESLGLLGLRERAQLLGGTMSIDSAAGQGTKVQVRIPMDGMDA